MLWQFTSDYCPNGGIGKFTDEQIAQAVDWRKPPEQLITALVESKWLDKNVHHRLVVHDWAEHCEDSVHARLARAGEYFADGKMPKLTKLNKEEKAIAAERYRHLAAAGGGIIPPALAIAMPKPGPGPEPEGALQPAAAGAPNSPPPSDAVDRSGRKFVSGKIAPVSSSRPAAPLDFDFPGWIDEQYARHPAGNRGPKMLALQYASQHPNIREPGFRTQVDEAHIAYCNSENWQWKNGAKAPTLADYWRDELWKFPPPRAQPGKSRSDDLWDRVGEEDEKRVRG